MSMSEKKTKEKENNHTQVFLNSAVLRADGSGGPNRSVCLWGPNAVGSAGTVTSLYIAATHTHTHTHTHTSVLSVIPIMPQTRRPLSHLLLWCLRLLSPPLTPSVLSELDLRRLYDQKSSRCVLTDRLWRFARFSVQFRVSNQPNGVSSPYLLDASRFYLSPH